MTGPEHYREAEALLRYAQDLACEDGVYLVAAAQVHATLAHAAADALVATATQAPHTTEAARDWREVLKPAEHAEVAP